jgi:hypothetical protein
MLQVAHRGINPINAVEVLLSRVLAKPEYGVKVKLAISVIVRKNNKTYPLLMFFCHADVNKITYLRLAVYLPFPSIFCRYMFLRFGSRLARVKGLGAARSLLLLKLLL